MNAPVIVYRTSFLIAMIDKFWLSITQRQVTMTQNSSTAPAQAPAETLACEIHRASGKHH